jgi:DNA-binding CsgD family transcriptional regulator
MTQLSRISKALLLLYSHCRADQFPKQVAGSLQFLFPEAILAIDELFKDSGELIQYFQSAPLSKKEFCDAARAYSHQHPGIQYVADGGKDPVIYLSDLISMPELRKLDLYQTVFKPANIKDQINFIVPSSLSSILGISVCLPGTVTADQRELAETLFPHLAQASANAALVSGSSFSSPSEQEYQVEISVSQGAPITSWPLRARRLLDVFFERRDSHPWQPPQELLTWIRSRRESFVHDFKQWRRSGPWVLNSKQGRLHINFSRGLVPHTEVLFLNGKVRCTPVDKNFDRLTPKEGQVVQWVVKGKSNAEIAIILSVRVATVKKHLENIFRKVVVENRMALTVSLLSIEDQKIKYPTLIV